MKILFICTHNRCRSILAEAITNHIGRGQLQAKSAGSQPAGEVHPLSIRYLQEAGIDTEGLISQSWDDHEDWEPDVVITVCDSAAGESCPVWFGKSIKVHWGLSDPSAISGSDEEITAAFRETISILHSRVNSLMKAGLAALSSDEIARLFLDLGNN